MTARRCNQAIVLFVWVLFIYLFIYYSFLCTNRHAKANHCNDGNEQRAWKKMLIHDIVYLRDLNPKETIFSIIHIKGSEERYLLVCCCCCLFVFVCCCFSRYDNPSVRFVHLTAFFVCFSSSFCKGVCVS